SSEIYSLSLHDALPIWDRVRVETGLGEIGLVVDEELLVREQRQGVRLAAAGELLERDWNEVRGVDPQVRHRRVQLVAELGNEVRSEEHTSELQSPYDLV